MAEVFASNFEVGDLSEWPSDFNTNGTLTVTPGAALAGTGFGCNNDWSTANTSDRMRAFPVLGTPATVPIWRVRWYYDPNGITGIGRFDRDTPIWLRSLNVDDVDIYFSGPTSGTGDLGVRLELSILTDSAVATNWIWEPLPAVAAWYELRVVAATGAAAADGFFDLYIDGVNQGGRTGIQRYTRAWPTDIYCGKNPNRQGMAGDGGSTFFDEIIIRDDDEVIGPAGGGGTDPYVAGNYVASEQSEGLYLPADYNRQG